MQYPESNLYAHFELKEARTERWCITLFHSYDILQKEKVRGTRNKLVIDMDWRVWKWLNPKRTHKVHFK